jgi:hypothetical protein
VLALSWHLLHQFHNQSAQAKKQLETGSTGFAVWSLHHTQLTFAPQNWLPFREMFLVYQYPGQSTLNHYYETTWVLYLKGFEPQAAITILAFYKVYLVHFQL